MVTTRVFGHMDDGSEVTNARLEAGDVSVDVLSYGAVTRDWRVPLDGARVPVVLGFERFEDYPAHSKSFGIIAGRVANRTARGQFTLNGQSYQLPINNGPNHLHGGLLGLGRRNWRIETDQAANAIQLTYHSPDGEEGYPGAVDFTVRMTLDGDALTYDMTALPDRPTPVNLAQHSYYNLGTGDVRDHHMTLAAHHYTPTDADLIPTGAIAPVSGMRLDFTAGAQIGDIDPDRKGIDLNLVLDDDRDQAAPAATVRHDNGLTLTLWTDQPGIQVFNAPEMQIPVPGLDGRTYGAFGGLCLEAQHFPDALNHPNFPSIIVTPDQPYRQVLRVRIGAS